MVSQPPIQGTKEKKPFLEAGNKLRKLRIEAGFKTLQSFCNKFNELFRDVELKTGTLSQYEIGYVRPSIRRCERLCTTLKTELENEEVQKLYEAWGKLREVKIHEPHTFSGKYTERSNVALKVEKDASTLSKKPVRMVSFDPEKFPELERYLNLCEKDPFVPEKTQRLSKKAAMARMERFLRSL